MARFLYWRDPLCLFGWFAYLLNHFYGALHFGGDFPFLRSHFNDIWLIAGALPLLAFARRKLGLRSHDQPPTVGEIGFWLVFWSLFFEVIGPRFWSSSVADPLDVLTYFVGAVFAWGFWRWFYNGRLRKPRLS